MRPRWTILLPGLLLACGAPPTAAPPAAPPADVVATWDGGAVGLAEIETAFATTRTPTCRAARRGGGGDELAACYREVAEALALERLVVADLADLDRALAGLEDYGELRRQAFLGVWLRRTRDEIEIGDDEIEARFAAEGERYRRPAAVDLANIFRRHQDPARPEATDEYLRRLKERYLAGETFDALAREHSQSETRLRGGEVGRVTADRLPPRLGRVAFALGEGEVSDPIRVRGGAVLLLVRNIVAAAEPSLEEARGAIRGRLYQERIAAAIAARVAGREPPAGSLILDLDPLLAALDGGDPRRVILDLEGDRLTVGELRRLAELVPSSSAAGLDESGRQRLAELYRRQLEQRLLARELVAAAEPDPVAEPDFVAAAEEELHRAAVARLVDRWIGDEIERLVDSEPDELGRYFDDNRHHYQSPLRFKLRRWTLLFAADPPRQLR